MKYTEASMNSTGSAMEKFGAYEEGIEAKANRMTSAFEKLSITLLDSGILKFLYDAGTFILNAISYGDAAVAKIIMVTTALLSIKGIAASFSASTFGRSILGSFKKVGSSLKMVGSSLKKLLPDLALYIERTTGVYAPIAKFGLMQASLATKIKLTTMALKEQAIAWAASPLGMVAIAGAAIYGLFKLTDALTTTVSEHREELSQFKTEYSDLKSEIDSLNSELKTTQDRIAELSGYKTLSFTDEQELINLQRINQELERKLFLKEEDEKKKQSELNSKFVKTMDSDVNKDYELYSNFRYENEYGSQVYKYISEKEYAFEAIEYYKKLKAEYAGAVLSGDKKSAENVKKNIDEIESYLNQKSEQWASDSDGIAYIENPITEEEKQLNAHLDFINDFMDKRAIALADNPAQAMAFAFSRVAGKEEFSGFIEEIKGMDSYLDIAHVKFKPLLDALIRCGFISDTSAASLQLVVDAVNKIASDSGDKAASKIKSISDSLKDLAGIKEQISDFSTAFKELRDDKGVGFDTLNKIRESFSEFVPEIDNYISKLASANSNTKEVSLVFTELTLAALESKYSVEQLASADENLIAKMLESANVANADELATYAVARAKEQLALSSAYAQSGVGGLINYLNSASKTSGISKNALVQLAAQIITTGNTGLSLEQQCSELRRLASEAYGASSAMATILNPSAVSSYMLSHRVNSDAARKALINKALNEIRDSVETPTYTPSVGGSGGGSSEYTADIDSLRAAKQRLLDVENAINTAVAKRELLDENDYAAQAKAVEELTVLYKDQQKALSQLNDARDSEIDGIVSKLKSAGFNVTYDSTYNKFWVDNIELLHTFSDAQEEVYDKLIQEAEKYNKENIEGSLEWWKLQKTIAELTKEARETEKNNLKEIIDLVKDQIKQETNDKIDALNEEKDTYKEIVSLQKESLDLAKRETDYKDNVAKLSKEIAKLQNQADLLGLDSSREAAVKRGQILEELAEKQKELANLQKDNYIDTTKESLDKDAEAYEKSIDKKIKELEDFLNDNEKLTKAAYDRIDSQGQNLYNDLLKYVLKYTEISRKEFDGMWNSAIASAQKYGSVVAALNGEYTDSAKENKISSIVGQMKQNSADWHKSDAAGRNQLSQSNQSLAEELKTLLPGLTYNSADGSWYINGKKLYDVYHTGGIVGGNGGTKQNEVMSLLENNEIVANEAQQDTLLNNFKALSSENEALSRLYSYLFTEIPTLISPEMIKLNSSIPVPKNTEPKNQVIVDGSITINGYADDKILSVIKKYPRVLADVISKQLKS